MLKNAWEKKTHLDIHASQKFQGGQRETYSWEQKGGKKPITTITLCFVYQVQNDKS